MRLFVIVLFVTGCGFRVGGTALDAKADAVVDGRVDAVGDGPIDGSIDGPIDAPIDAAPTCLDRWTGHTIRFDAPIPLATVNSASAERDPFLTADELSLFLSSGRAGLGSSDLYVTSRPGVASAFGAPVVLSELASLGNDNKLTLAENGLLAILSSDRLGGDGEFDLWSTTRSSLSAPFTSPDNSKLQNVNTSASEHDPFLNGAGTRLYLAPTGGGQHLAVASRNNTNGAFSSPAELTELTSGAGEADPALSPDERVIVFTSNRALATTGGGNLWYATRATSTEPFGTPLPVPDLNTGTNEGDPHLSADGCRLYFARDGGATGWDLLVATAQ